ncbi:MAG: hypothetical protein K0Q68_290 [Moraxellaceae bacterium]|jgi:uncharacterized membrane protein YkvA (DUF1232 family)|nr:hypothetical protein [Moraxellaceae bacterium]
MGYVLKADQLKFAIAETSSFDSQPPYEFMPGDEELTREILESPSILALLPSGDGGALPPSGADGEMVLESPDGRRYFVPPRYQPLVSIVALHSGAFAQDASLQILQKFFDYLRDLLGWIMTRKASLRTQVEDILKDADSIYESFRLQVHGMQKQHDDHIISLVLLIPDLFVYLCRLFADKDVDRRAKGELILALVYLVSPVDILPEAIIPPPYGFLDDIGIVLYFLRRSMRDGYVDRAAFERNWPGDPGFLDAMEEWWQTILTVLDEHFIESIVKAVRGRTKKGK